jgi:hypothetical protein
MAYYGIPGGNEYYNCIARYAPSGAVLMNTQRPSIHHICDTAGCAEGFGVWILDPMREWEANMAALDVGMERAIEDIWDVIGIENAPPTVQDAYNAKKAEREKKPK